MGLQAILCTVKHNFRLGYDPFYSWYLACDNCGVIIGIGAETYEEAQRELAWVNEKGGLNSFQV